MELHYHPKTPLEKFGGIVFNTLVENFPQSYYVGGLVRDLILQKEISDIDIATSATPEQIIDKLKTKGIPLSDANKKFGSVIAKRDGLEVEITTLRQDIPSPNRYPKVKFVKSPKTDSARRDFTINALYFKPKDSLVLDYHRGLNDIKNKEIRFIGNAKKRIEEDPLRIIRGVRIALSLNFKLQAATKYAIKKNFFLIDKLTRTKLEKEISKIKNKIQQNSLRKVINNHEYLDNFFKLL